jgi:hypothetical protein
MRFAVSIFLFLLSWCAIEFKLGDSGLERFGFDGQALLAQPKDGELSLAAAHIGTSDDAEARRLIATTFDKATQTVRLSYSWGSVSCKYEQPTERQVSAHVIVTNNSPGDLHDITLCLSRLTFPQVPDAGSLEAGMFGYGFKGDLSPMYRWKYAIDGQFSVPILRVKYGSTEMDFCADDLTSALEISSPSNHENTRYGFNLICKKIMAGEQKNFDVSFRFGSAGDDVRSISGDIVEAYRKKYPFQLRWDDHRPIGAIYLASSGIKVSTNPRRWILNSGKLDVTTEQGKSDFRAALLKLANSSVNVLKNCDAQGMITWDPEGQEFLSAAYYGDPRLVSTVAPEMEFKGDSSTSTIDAYFERFRAAGLKVGVCIRPQQIQMTHGTPIQGDATNENATQVLLDKIAYARKRWGCTLFYIDSTVTEHRSLNPDVFEAIVNANPNILLIPENESMRYFAYSAPLNSYLQHKITSTPVGARLIYPDAFSVLMAQDGDRSEDHGPLVESVQHGDILLFNSWYPNVGARKIKDLYDAAMLRN